MKSQKDDKELDGFLLHKIEEDPSEKQTAINFAIQSQTQIS